MRERAGLIDGRKPLPMNELVKCCSERTSAYVSGSFDILVSVSVPYRAYYGGEGGYAEVR